MKFCIFAGSTIVGWLGWELAGMVTDDIMMLFGISAVASVFGLFVGYKVACSLDIT
jgi:membrane associated rhomboid family serine protease